MEEIMRREHSRVKKLSPKFYADYDEAAYPEILRKKNRPYNCLFFSTKDYVICVPFRSNVNHRYGFRFKKSARSTKSRSGLDYKKIVIIKNTEYIGDDTAVIDKDEFTEAIENISKIKKEVLKFINDYVRNLKGEIRLDTREFNRRYQWSSLQYFHKELGLS